MAKQREGKICNINVQPGNWKTFFLALIRCQGYAKSNAQWFEKPGLSVETWFIADKRGISNYWALGIDKPDLSSDKPVVYLFDNPCFSFNGR